MDIKTIISDIGGVSKAAKLSSIPRQTIEYWLEEGRWPRWRNPDVAILAALAKRISSPKPRRRAA